MMENWLIHSGVGHDDDPPGRGSGRYGWGTGSNPEQHQFDFLSEVKKMRSNGIKDSEIARALLGPKGYTKSGEPIWPTTVDLRAEIAIADKAKRKINIQRAIKTLDECQGNVSEAARRMGVNESTMRSWLNPALAERQDRYDDTAAMLRKVIDERVTNGSNVAIDISKGTELYLGCNENTKKVAVAMLEKEGYVRTKVQIPQVGTQNKTTIEVLAPPGTLRSEIQKRKTEVGPIQTFTPDTGKTWWTPEFPAMLDSSRVKIRYDEEGGSERDGVIQIRRGVEDLSLEGSQYAQVRIGVDGTHYMKGMAIYSDDIPKGYDIVYNTNKKIGTPPEKVFKELKTNPKTGEVDQNNPFGALIKGPKERDGVIMPGGQHYYVDSKGNERLSPINKLQDEGDWDSWSRNLSAQFLSKQPLKIIKQQMDLSIAGKKADLEQILELTNPVVKKRLLEDYASSCDANAADLSVKGFKDQSFQVILPIPEMKNNEIYAPNYKDGDTVALVRYPHGGIFEIPVLKINNKQPQAKSIMQNSKDAVGINKHNADILSGGDFDGDTALVIPIKSNNLSISTRPPLKGLEGFDGKALYKLPDSAPKMRNSTKQNEMGRVTNLITDMTVGGANWDEICRAVKHSMVVIDAEKHHLDYKQSEKDNGIIDLKKKYQGVNSMGQAKGASTILSRSKSEVYVDKRKEITKTSDMTSEELKRWNEGKRVYRSSEEKLKVQITDTSKMTPEELKAHNEGKRVYRESNKNRKIKVTQMDTVDDARELVRDRNNQKEMAYADYANSLKRLAEQARRESRAITPTPVSQSAKEAYASEVSSLMSKLRVALMNTPKERQAQVIANNLSSETFNSNPDMDFEHRQRERALNLTRARAMVGASKEPITITDKEWEAIQSNAISTNRLEQIVSNSNIDVLKELATPRGRRTSLSSAQISLMKAMLSSGMYTQKEIAERLGVSVSAISKELNK